MGQRDRETSQVHLVRGRLATPLCRIHERWKSCVIRGARRWRLVTCKRCLVLTRKGG